ncbi:hypothetical protein TcBrA4_0065900 [Trypanosoma cruzi]|nr:hypothetical protein TcBrA4_0065900 [Trypanosoma cruzi]
MYPKKKEERNQALRRCSAVLWKPARKNLEPHPARGGDIFTAWWRRTSSSGIGCARTDLGAYAPCLSNRQICLFVILCRFHVPYAYTAAAARCTPLVPGGWEMDRPFPPYVLDVTIRDFLLDSAPGPDDMLNEFLHRLGPVARGTLGTMIHNSFANGSLPGS